MINLISHISFVILIKNNTDTTLMFNSVIQMVYPDILPCIQHYYKTEKPNELQPSLKDLLYNGVVEFKIKPGFNRYVLKSQFESGQDEYTKNNHDLMNILFHCHDPKSRFEWTTQAASYLMDTKDYDITWDSDYAYDVYRKQKLIKSVTRKPKKIVKKCKCR